jgi:hypothetical protein
VRPRCRLKDDDRVLGDSCLLDAVDDLSQRWSISAIRSANIPRRSGEVWSESGGGFLWRVHVRKGDVRVERLVASGLALDELSCLADEQLVEERTDLEVQLAHRCRAALPIPALATGTDLVLSGTRMAIGIPDSLDAVRRPVRQQHRRAMSSLPRRSSRSAWFKRKSP